MFVRRGRDKVDVLHVVRVTLEQLPERDNVVDLRTVNVKIDQSHPTM